MRQVQKTKIRATVQHFNLTKGQIFRQGVLKKEGHKNQERKHLVQNLVQVGFFKLLLFFLLDQKA